MSNNQYIAMVVNGIMLSAATSVFWKVLGPVIGLEPGPATLVMAMTSTLLVVIPYFTMLAGIYSIVSVLREIRDDKREPKSPQKDDEHS